jgi:hypothetical protein
MHLRPPLVLVHHGVGDVPAEHDPDRLFIATRIEPGSHTRTHRDLSRVDVDAAFEEMSSSKTALEEIVDRGVVSFANTSCGYSENCPGQRSSRATRARSPAGRAAAARRTSCGGT